ncbi:MAG: hypothetical protein IPI02_23060 [Sterolibacteriaceae bacterium]|nr:hypothetical protein [Sterolibacteriaceae bacterium]
MPRWLSCCTLIKLLHELAHGLAVRRWGGKDDQAGITLMLGPPVPWSTPRRPLPSPNASNASLVPPA